MTIKKSSERLDLNIGPDGTYKKYPPQHSEKYLGEAGKSFPWNDDDDDEGTLEQPEYSVANDIITCAESLLSFLKRSISLDRLQDCKLVVEINPDLHHLLSTRLDNKFSMESRLRVFDLIRCSFNQLCSFEKDRIQDKIKEEFSEFKDLVIKEVVLYDDPSVGIIGEDGPERISIEIVFADRIPLSKI